jgi:putative GTP pyrophosphokinase
LQDLIGIRIVLYFNEDISNARDIISSIYQEVSKDHSIDHYKSDEFKALRYNIIYKLTDDQIDIIDLNELSGKVDSTFELQIRTVFSEGWHEVEHDLRYKCKNDWNGHDQYSRRLNGVYASLETNEWTMIQIFEELAYCHYKAGDYSAMIRQKFRLRFSDTVISTEIIDIFSKSDIAKKFFRLDRAEIIKKMNQLFNYPLTMDNFICFCNLVCIKEQELIEKTPELMKEELELAMDS